MKTYDVLFHFGQHWRKNDWWRGSIFFLCSLYKRPLANAYIQTNTSHTSNDHYTSGDRILLMKYLVTKKKKETTSIRNLYVWLLSFSFLLHWQAPIQFCIISNYRESARRVTVTIVPKRVQERIYKLIRCHCFGSNLTLVYNLRYSFLFSIQYAS
jgi:hypothetical protein